MFTFECDSCHNTGQGLIINDAILNINHKRFCEMNKGIPVHFTRVNTKDEKFVCVTCNNDEGWNGSIHAKCVKSNDKNEYCECCGLK